MHFQKIRSYSLSSCVQAQAPLTLHVFTLVTITSKWYQFPRTVIANYQELCGFKQQKFVLTVLEARNLKSRCQGSHAPSKGSREEGFLSLPNFQGLPTILVLPDLHRHPPSSASFFTCCSPCVPVSESLTFSVIRTSVIG